MFETGYCDTAERDCIQMTGLPVPACRFYVTFETTGRLVHFTVDNTVEVDWGDGNWRTYEASVIIGEQLDPYNNNPVQVRSHFSVEAIHFSNRAGNDTNYLSIWIHKAYDLRDCKRMCYGLLAMEEFQFTGSNKVTTFESAWENCVSLTKFYDIDIGDAVSIRRAWKNCNSLVNMVSIYSDTCLTAEEAFMDCESMVNYEPIILEVCQDYKKMFWDNKEVITLPLMDTFAGKIFNEMLYRCVKLACIKRIDTRGITNKYYTTDMFAGCLSLIAPNEYEQETIKSGALYESTECIDTGACRQLTVLNPITFENDYFVTASDEPFFTSTAYGSCGDGAALPDYGLDCTAEIDCPDCNTFNVYNSLLGWFDKFVPLNSDSMSVGYKYDSCTNSGGLPNPDLDYGLQCTPSVDCEDCNTFNVLLPDASGFQMLKPTVDDNFKVGVIEGGCSIGSVYDYPFEAYVVTAKAGKLRFELWNQDHLQYEYRIGNTAFQSIKSLDDIIISSAGLTVYIRCDVEVEIFNVSQFPTKPEYLTMAQLHILNAEGMTGVSGLLYNQDNIETFSLPYPNEITDFRSMCKTDIGISSLVAVGKLYTAKGQLFGGMFAGADKLTCLHEIDTRNQTDTYNMFDGCVSLMTPDASQQAQIMNGSKFISAQTCVMDGFNVFDTQFGNHIPMFTLNGKRFNVLQ